MFSRPLLGLIGLDWVKLVFFVGFHWILLGLTEFYWVFVGFTGLYWVSLDCTGFNCFFCWVSLNFAGFN